VLGLDPLRDGPTLKRRIGVVLQQGGIYPALTAREVLRLFASFHDQPEDPDALLEIVGLAVVSRTRYRRLSGGQQRRLALAVALVGKPDVLFLDEPTAGMDPQARRLTWELVRGLSERGTATLLTTHLLDEAEHVASTVAIMDHGKLLVQGPPRQLIGSASTGRVTVRVVLPQSIDTRALENLPAVLGVQQTEATTYAIATTDPAACLAQITAWLRDTGIVAQELRVGDISLEDVFLRLTGKALRE
jgi:ABC-2 type transport system ATP-binding protein